jgi:hypothetical protein
MSKTARAHYVLAHVVLAGVVFQFLFAGLGTFGAASFEIHAIAGDVPSLLAFVTVVLAAVARRAFAWSVALFAALVVQRFLPDLAGSAPVVAALHILNAALILFLALTVFRGDPPPLRAVEREGHVAEGRGVREA